MINGKDVNISLAPGSEEVVIRFGEAPPVARAMPVLFVGTIGAPLEFYIKRKAATVEKRYALSTIVENYFDPLTTHVEVNINQRSIELIRNSDKENADKIAGMLKDAPILKALQLNSTTGWQPLTLCKFLRVNSHIFKDNETAKEVVDMFKSFSLNVSTNIEQTSDSRGSKKSLQDQQTKSNLPEHIDLLVPLFENTAPVNLRVNVFFEVINNRPEVFLEVPGLEDIISKQAAEEIAAITSAFDSDGITVLWA